MGTAGKHGTEVNMHDGKCGKRKHGAEVEEETGPTISRFASPNYFQVFQDSDIDLEFVDLDEESNYFYQAQPTKVIPARHGKEHVILLRRDGAGVGKKKKPDSIKAAFKSMKADCDNVPISGSRSAADLFSAGTPQVLTHGSNGDNILKHIRADPATACGQLSLLMQEQADAVDDLAELHLITRILGATYQTYLPFQSKLKNIILAPIASKQQLFELFKALRPQDELTEQGWEQHKALALLELVFMAAAPRLFQSEFWLHYLAKTAPGWIPTFEQRLLDNTVLLQVLRSPIGAFFLERWETLKWKSELPAVLAELRDGKTTLSPDRSTLFVVQEPAGTVVLREGPFPTQY
ncbi:hypothetical protein Poli38472_006319 [Pythium oligandrum]|uniref:Uncharacterized protein n=1 Tax=Pythium oligandrum TaxID=41045 RepID=A0A8K1FN03_PYTOL|nr:hypothetical protein Poli38472_006319 [Pythium oligandrum]|eukprot:TMW68851.1 hypothetical protein Poli38472_006319 [Pythium oligandrum]